MANSTKPSSTKKLSSSKKLTTKKSSKSAKKSSKSTKTPKSTPAVELRYRGKALRAQPQAKPVKVSV